MLPTPPHYALWFIHLSGTNKELSQALGELLANTPSPSTEALAALHSRFLGAGDDMDNVLDGAEEIRHAAQDVADQVAVGRTDLASYGKALAHWGCHLHQDRTLEGLLKAVDALTTETARAGERNRALEQQLSTSVVKISKLKDTLADVRREATTDNLTGLCNRRSFDAHLRRAMTKAKAEGGTLSVALLDLDHFKQVNDTYGHPAGDLVLRLVGRLLSDSIKGRDTAARYGGEEFAVLLAGADLRAATVVAGQIRAALDGKRLVNKVSRRDIGSVSISAGVAEFRPGETSATLLNRADAALYEAKRLGRNQVRSENEVSATAAAG